MVNKAHIFALTGGIASGKSSVAATFQSLALPVVDADLLAREVVEAKSEGLAALVDAFGPTILTSEGQLSRPTLGKIIFSDPEARRKTEAILHPRIRALAEQRFASLAAAGNALICYEVPLLFETGQEDRFRPVVLVSAKPEQQLAWLSARSGMSREEATARLAAQMPLAEKLRRADIVIENDEGLVDLERKAADALAEVRARLTVSQPAVS